MMESLVSFTLGGGTLNAACVCVCVHICFQDDLCAKVCVCERDKCVRLHTLLAVFTRMLVHHCSIIVKICKINMILFKKYINMF